MVDKYREYIVNVYCEFSTEVKVFACSEEEAKMDAVEKIQKKIQRYGTPVTTEAWLSKEELKRLWNEINNKS